MPINICQDCHKFFAGAEREKQELNKKLESKEFETLIVNINLGAYNTTDALLAIKNLLNK